MREDEAVAQAVEATVSRLGRIDILFNNAGLAPPTQLIETASLLFVTKMLQQTDFIAVVPTEVARYYATYGMIALLPMQLSCSMDAFGIITRTDWLLSPAASEIEGQTIRWIAELIGYATGYALTRRTLPFGMVMSLSELSR